MALIVRPSFSLANQAAWFYGAAMVCFFLATLGSARADQIPENFSRDYLSGKTFYLVWFGSGQDENGNELDDDVPVVHQIEFNADGTAVGTGLMNSANFQAPWAVDGVGLLYFGGIATEGHRIACNHTDDFIRTHYLNEEGFDNVDLFFFDRQKALDYAATLKYRGPEPCPNGPGLSRIPSVAISIDGLNTDWHGIAPILTDPANDQNGSSATDIRALYAAIDENANRFSVLLEVDGTIQMPHTPTQEFSHYNVNLNYYYDLGCNNRIVDYYDADNEYGFGGQWLNDFTKHDGQYWHTLDQFRSTGDIASYPTTTAHQSHFLETGFDLNNLPPGARSVRFYPSTRSYDPSRNEIVHDEANSSCYLLPFAFVTPPSVVRTQPADNTVGVAADQPIVVQFDRSMDSNCDLAKLKSWIYALEDIGGQISWAQTVYPKDTLTFVPDTRLLSSMYYEASLDCRNSDGFVMGMGRLEVDFNFITAGTPGDNSAPQVTSTSPYAGQSVNVTLPIYILFDKPIDPASVTTESLQVTGPGAPTYRWRSGGYFLQIWPQGLQARSDYQVTLTTAVTDGEGHGLAAPYSFGFNTGTGDTTAPRILQTLPADQGTLTEWNELNIFFSENMDPDSLRADATVAVFDETNEDAPIGIALLSDYVDVNGPHEGIQIQRAFAEGARWQVGHTYRVELAGTIADLWGNPLGRDQVLRFSVVDWNDAPPNLDAWQEIVAQRHPDGRVTIDIEIGAWSTTGSAFDVEVTDLTQTGKRWDDFQFVENVGYVYTTPDGGDEGLTAGNHDLRITATDPSNGQTRSLLWNLHVFNAVPALTGGPADGATGVALEPEFSLATDGIVGAAAYEIILTGVDAGDAFDHRIPILADTRTAYSLPIPHSRALEPNKTYRWKVQAVAEIETDGGLAFSESRTFTTGNDVTDPQEITLLETTSPSVVGAGAGNDLYVLRELPTGKRIRVSDIQGENILQLISGLVIDSSEVAQNALRLTLRPGAQVTILGADAFLYDVGGDATLEVNHQPVSFEVFVREILGATVPESGVVHGGSTTIGAP